jgi:alkaline phosphatase D
MSLFQCCSASSLPIATALDEPRRVYRRISYGPPLDVFMLDMSTNRGPNGDNLETVEGGKAAFLADEQLAWLKRELASSKAIWKVIGADMPLSLVMWNDADNKKDFEAVSNNNDKPLGRDWNSPTCCASSMQRA